MKWFLNTSYDGMPFVTFFEIKRLRTKKKKTKLRSVTKKLRIPSYSVMRYY